MMKILFLTEFFPDSIGESFTGGVEARVFYLSKYLADRHEVKVERRTGNYSFNSLLTAFQRFIFVIKEILKLFFDNRRFDIVEGTNFVTYVAAYFRARRTGAKAVAWYPDVFVGQGIKRLGLVSGLLTEIAERISLKLNWDKIIALSQETKKKLIANGIDSEKIEVVYGGVNTNQRSKIPAKDGAGKNQKYRNPTILCISRLVDYKRVNDLILAVYLIKEKFPDIQLIIVGNGPQKKNYQLQVTNYGLQNNIRFLGRVSEEKKWELLRRSHIHVLPSVVEGFGLVSIEALAVGTPVINADIPVNREILSELQVTSYKLQDRKQRIKLTRGGLLFRSGDYVDLAEKMESLLEDKELYNQKVAEGKELVKRYDWEKVNQQTEKIYQRLLSD